MADPKSREGHSYLTQNILGWVECLHSPHDESLRQAFDSHRTQNLPQIQISPSEGKLLTLLLKLNQAKKVIEIGTLAGYSTLWISKGLSTGGHIWTLEANPQHVAVARENFKSAKQSSNITILEGKADKTLSQIEQEGPFDAVFIDADKSNYDFYAKWAHKNLRRGGLIIGDNAFLFGKLLDEASKIQQDQKKSEQEDEVRAMQNFHTFVSEHFDSACIPTPDGLVVGIKK